MAPISLTTHNKDLPPLPPLHTGWQIVKPDASYLIDEFTLGSNGPEDRQTFTVETNLEIRQLHLPTDTLEIPPNAEKHTVTSQTILKEDAGVLSYLGLMGYRGPTMRFDATYPGGRNETLLMIRNYDLQWQTRYLNAKPLKLARGMRITLTATYGNSANNPSIADPSKTIGPPDEKMDGWIEFY